ncbi:unnamed protein product [Closterium sp. NIES-54]
MASLSVLTFDHEGHPIQFDTWLDNLHLCLLSDSRDSVSMFDHTSAASLAPPATPDSVTRSQWLTRDAAACLAIRNHLPLAEHTHFGQHKTAKALYDAVVTRYSSPATAALGHLILPYLFPELSAFVTVEDLITHFRTSDTCYRAALLAELLDKSPPSIVVAIGAARGTPRTPFFDGCSPSPLNPFYASAAAVDILGTEDVGAASALSGKRRSGKGKGGKSGRCGSGGGGGGGVEVVEVVAAVGVVAGVGAVVAAVVAAVGVGVAVVAAVGVVAAAVVAIGVELFRGEVLAVARGSSSNSVGARPLRPSSFASGLLSVGRLRVVFGVDIFALDYDAILAAMYALSVTAEGDCYLCVPPDPGIDAAALGASESALPSIAPAQALHTFTLDSVASRYFFRDNTTLTPLPAPVLVRLGDPSGGPVLAHSSTVLSCPAVLFSSLSGLYFPPGCRSARVHGTGRHQATFTRRPGSSLYTLTTETPQVAASGQVSVSGPVAAPCTCRLLSHQTLLWHHHLGHSSLPRLRGMHSCFLVSGLPRSLPPLPPSPALPCLPSVEGRQRAAPHSSSPPTNAHLQTLHMDVWVPACVSGQDHEHYFLLVVDDYTRYTTVFPMRSKGKVPDLLIPWICAVRLQLRERFREDLHVLRLHSNRGGEFSSDLLRDFCCGEGILHSFTLPASPQQNGVAERRIGLVMLVACTSMIQAAAPHFLWPFVVRYAAHQLNLWPRVSLPETLPTLRWTGKVGDASVFRVWGSRAFVRDTSADKLSSRAIPCVLLGFPPDAPGWQFYHPTLRRGPAPSGVSQVDPLPQAEPVEVTIDFGAAMGTASGGAESASAEPWGAEPWGAEREGAEPRGAESKGVETGGAEPEGAEPGGAESEVAEFGGAEPRVTVSPGCLASASPRLSHRGELLSPQQQHKWFAQCTRLRSGAARAGGPAARGIGVGGAGATSPGGAGVTVGAEGIRGAGAAGPGGARNRGTRARDPGVGGTCAGGAGAGGTGAGGAGASSSGGAGVTVEAGGTGGAEAANPRGARTQGNGAGCAGAGRAGARGARDGGAGAGGAGTRDAGAGGTGAGDPGAREVGAGGAGVGGTGVGGTVQRRPLFVSPPPSSLPPPDSVLRQVLSLPSSTGLTPSLLCPPPHQTQPQLQLDSALPSPPYAEQTESLRERHEPESRPASPVRAVRTGHRVSLVRVLLLFPALTLWHFVFTSVPLRLSLPSPPTSSHADCPHLESNLARAASPTVPRLLATVFTDPSFESTAVSALVAELVDFAAACRLDYADSIVAEFESDCLPSVGGECALGTDVLEDRQEEFQCFAAAVPHLVAMVLAPEGDLDAPDIPTPRSYIEAITGSPPVFKARYVARGFSQRQGVDFFQTFSSTPKMTTLRAPCVWHDTLRMTLAALGFAPSTADPSLFLRNDTSLLPFYVRIYLGLQITRDRARQTITLTQSQVVHQVLQRFGFSYSSPQSTPLPTSHSLSAPPSDESVEPSGPYPELVGCLMYLMICTRPDLAYPLSILTRYVAPWIHRLENWEAAKRVLRYL